MAVRRHCLQTNGCKKLLFSNKWLSEVAVFKQMAVKSHQDSDCAGFVNIIYKYVIKYNIDARM